MSETLLTTALMEAIHLNKGNQGNACLISSGDLPRILRRMPFIAASRQTLVRSSPE